ncbi:hypothetical protein ACFXC2_41110, partial [Streptomyces lavendulae]
MTPRHPLVPRRTGAAAAALGLVLVLAPAVARAAVPADGAAARDDVPQGTVAYRATASFTNAGRPRDLLLHPESKKLYVGSDDLPETTGANESGLHVLEPGRGATPPPPRPRPPPPPTARRCWAARRRSCPPRGGGGGGGAAADVDR